MVALKVLIVYAVLYLFYLVSNAQYYFYSKTVKNESKPLPFSVFKNLKKVGFISIALIAVHFFYIEGI